jgi:hypothetical protein
MLANLEGDLNEDESLELKAFISLNPKTKLEYNFYRSTFLKPDHSIQVSNKADLKKTGLLVIYRTQLVYGLSIAATIIILLGVYFSFFDKTSKPGLADTINTKSVTSGESLFNDRSKIKPLQKIEYRHNEQEVRVALQDSGEKVEHKAAGFAWMEITQIRFLAYENPTVIKMVNPVSSDSQFSAISEMELTSKDDVKTQKTFVSRFVGALAGKVIKTDNLRGKSFLDYTIDGYNLMADKDVSLEKEMDETGKVIAYSLDGENLSFFKNKNQQKE